MQDIKINLSPKRPAEGMMSWALAPSGRWYPKPWQLVIDSLTLADRTKRQYRPEYVVL